MPQPSSRERAREIVARVMNTAKDSVMGTAFRGAITAAIDAAVEAEREACAKACSDYSAARSMKGAVREAAGAVACETLIDARGGDRE